MEAQAERWPRVVGTIGIVVGVVMFVDKLNDLVMLPLLRSGDWWARLLGERLAADVMRWMPSSAWIVVSSLVGMTLGALLFVGAWRLRRGRRSGATLCRAWSWLALVWILVEIGWALYWLSDHLHEFRELARGDWQAPAALGILLTFIVLAAFPVFLLIWLSRPVIQARIAGWPR